MEIFNKLRKTLSSALHTPEQSVDNPAQSVWTKQLKPQAFTSLNTDHRHSAAYFENERIQQQLREELGKSISLQADRIIAQMLQATTFALTPDQCAILDRFNLEYGPSTNFNWKLFKTHTPESFREAYPELYI